MQLTNYCNYFQLIEHKTEIEKEKSKLYIQNLTLIEKNNEMKFQLESKDAIIKKLQKQILEVSHLKIILSKKKLLTQKNI